MTGENMRSLIADIDKKDETYSFRLPEITKKLLDKLPASLKNELNEALLLTCTEIIHKSKFNPRLYLTTREIE